MVRDYLKTHDISAAAKHFGIPAQYIENWVGENDVVMTQTSSRIDLTLAVMDAINKPNHEWNIKDMAYVAGVAPETMRQVYLSALQKALFVIRKDFSELCLKSNN